MSDSFEIVSSTGSYGVRLVPGAFSEWAARWRNDVVIADDFFRTAAPALAALPSVLYYPAHETVKSLDAAPELIERLRKQGANRRTLFVAVGGGVIQDLVAFAASIYMRGVQWHYVPTTILAMVDSCIGGKSSINVGPYKNLVGTFHPPQTVWIDPELARTLPLDQQASGIIEAAKICFCRGPQSFREYLSTQPHPGMDSTALGALILHSLHAKKWFIEIDEFDKNERLLLNFGHTFGHAIEGASHYAISHGIAVGLGILCALEFVRQSSPDRDPYGDTPNVAMLAAHLDTLIRAVPNLKEPVGLLSLNEVLERFESDKKQTQDAYTLILVEPTGEVALKRIAKSAEVRSRVEQAIRSIVEIYRS